MPALAQFWKDHAADRDRFAIVAFHDDTVADMEELEGEIEKLVAGPWKGEDLPFPVLLDAEGDTIETYGIMSFPTTMIVDPEGNIVGAFGEEVLAEKLAGEK